MFRFRHPQMGAYPMGQYIRYGRATNPRDYLHLPDHGCQYAPKCVACPRERCKHDEEQVHPSRKLIIPGP